MKVSWYTKKWGRIALHIAAWLIVLSLPNLLRLNPGNDPRLESERNAFFYISTITSLFWVALFYLNLLVLTPRFFFKKKYLSYIALVLLVFSLIMLVHSVIFKTFTQRPFILVNSIMFNITPFLLCVTVSTIYRMIQDKNRTEKLMLEQQDEKLKTELSFLRSQISPHFLFNVLNNMLALSRLKSDQLEPTIFKLSSLMRYMLYETDGEKVPLKKEIEYLQSYIDLQKQRLGNKLKLNIIMSISSDDHEIAPMLLIPFIENAFKHGVGNIVNPQIDVDLHTDKDILYFNVRNRHNISGSEEKDPTSGIGLINVNRRLELLYNKHYQLDIKNYGDWFTVSLKLNLAK